MAIFDYFPFEAAEQAAQAASAYTPPPSIFQPSPTFAAAPTPTPAFASSPAFAPTRSTFTSPTTAVASPTSTFNLSSITQNPFLTRALGGRSLFSGETLPQDLFGLYGFLQPGQTRNPRAPFGATTPASAMFGDQRVFLPAAHKLVNQWARASEQERMTVAGYYGVAYGLSLQEAYRFLNDVANMASLSGTGSFVSLR